MNAATSTLLSGARVDITLGSWTSSGTTNKKGKVSITVSKDAPIGSTGVIKTSHKDYITQADSRLIQNKPINSFKIYLQSSLPTPGVGEVLGAASVAIILKVQSSTNGAALVGADVQFYFGGHLYNGQTDGTGRIIIGLRPNAPFGRPALITVSLAGYATKVESYVINDRPPLQGITIVLVPTASGDCTCGIAQRATKIVGGQETEVNEWPWQVGMVWSGSSSVFCGATVISDEWILTAAHCTDGTGANEIQVLMGEHDYWDGSETNMVRMDIAEIVNHEDYNSNTVDNDFALLRMANKIDWAANPNIRPACLPSAGSGDYDQWMSTVTGWGTTSSGGSVSNVLLEVDVKVISNSECNNAYGGITNNMLCAADASGNGGSDACQGDSGGPLVSCGADGNCGTTPGQNYDLIGVVSFGIGCAQADFPGVYARTTAALDWIYTNAMPFETCSRGV